jgi:hypothetical protein
MLKDYPTILIEDFNIDMLKKHINQQHFKILCTNTNWNSLFLKAQSLIIHIDYSWFRVLTQQCHSGVTQAYWIDHKPIYFTFKLPYYVPQSILP